MKLIYRKRLVHLFLLFLLFACADSESNEMKFSDTSLLASYLADVNEAGLKEREQLYVIVPAQGCFGCMQKSLMAFSNLIDSNIQANTTMIVSNRNKDVLAAIPEGIYTIQDSLRKIDQLSLSLNGVRFIKSKFKVVTANEYFGLEELHLLKDFIVGGYKPDGK